MPRYSCVPIALVLVAITACSDATAPSGDVTVTTEEQIQATQADVYSGSRGLVVDTRELFRKGYEPKSVVFSFPDYARFDTEVEVDPYTNLAILVIENDSLTDAEFEAFEDGSVQSEIVIYGDNPGAGAPAFAGGPARVDAGDVALASSDTPRTLDASNVLIPVDNDSLPELIPPLALAEATPYLLVAEGDGAVTRSGPVNPGPATGGFFSREWPYLGNPVIDGDPLKYLARDTVPGGIPRRRQGFYFTPVPDKPDTYHIRSYSRPDLGTYLSSDTSDRTTWHVLIIGAGQYSFPYTHEILPGVFETVEGPGEFLVVQEEGGRVRIQDTQTGLFLTEPSRTGGQPWTMDAQGARFRLLPPEAELSIENLGTSFNQPILPPARIDLASESTIRNCSESTIEEIVGRTETRSITTVHSTSESFQIISDTTQTTTNSVSTEVQVRLVGPESDITGRLSGGGGYTNDQQWVDTYSSTRTWDTTHVSAHDTTTSVEVTHTRAISVPRYTSIIVTDWVRSAEDLVIPWTQTMRIRGKDRETDEPLSGREIFSLLRANRVGAVPFAISANSIDVTLRGSTTADNFYQTETNIYELANACTE